MLVPLVSRHTGVAIEKFRTSPHIARYIYHDHTSSIVSLPQPHSLRLPSEERRRYMLQKKKSLITSYVLVCMPLSLSIPELLLYQTTDYRVSTYNFAAAITKSLGRYMRKKPRTGLAPLQTTATSWNMIKAIHAKSVSVSCSVSSL